MFETLSAMYTFMPWMSAVTAISVVVARMMPSSVRKLRSLFLCNELKAMRVASQKEALGRNLRGWLTGSLWNDGGKGLFVPDENAAKR